MGHPHPWDNWGRGESPGPHRHDGFRGAGFYVGFFLGIAAAVLVAWLKGRGG